MTAIRASSTVRHTAPRTPDQTAANLGKALYKVYSGINAAYTKLVPHGGGVEPNQRALHAAFKKVAGPELPSSAIKTTNGKTTINGHRALQVVGESGFGKSALYVPMIADLKTGQAYVGYPDTTGKTGNHFFGPVKLPPSARLVLENPTQAQLSQLGADIFSARVLR